MVKKEIVLCKRNKDKKMTCDLLIRNRPKTKILSK